MPDHPLTGDPNWVFNQPDIEVKASCVVFNPSTRRVISVGGSSSCREGIISKIRQDFILRIVTRETDPDHPWLGYTTRMYDIDLECPRGKRKGKTLLSIHLSALGRESVQKFLHVTDAILGPIALLLNPNRPVGCCTPSTPTKNVDKGGRLVWKGVDNTFLYSPALVAMVTGLYRQCVALCRAGYADQVLSKVDRREVRRVIAKNDVTAARRMIQDLRPWIEVPIPKGARRTNMVFPPGYFSRLEFVIEAIEKHGVHEVFSKNFLPTWALTPKKIDNYYGGLKGLWAEWGAVRPTSRYQRIARLAAERRSRSATRAK